MVPDLPKNKKIILFDGVCNLCNASVLHIIKHDKKDQFRFVALQSDLGKQILKYIGVDTSKTDSIILYEPGRAYYYKSGVAMKIAESLDGLFFMSLAFRFVPIFLRDPLYDYVARNRYKWYGKQELCMIPTPELASKFL